MAPSRGFRLLIPRFSGRHVRKISNITNIAINSAINSPKTTQIYLSQSLDPYFNLSIEHYLLRKTPVHSTILFLFTNGPSIILGRNQNPWVEVNLGMLRENADTLGVQLVRRRSGGGTVFHDEGNVNYSVICPSADFDRDKHAEMVVKALKSLGITRARVNDRHDIVLDDLKKGESTEQPRKISGSAYKLTRLRSLHHGTCLLSSPNINAISQYLRAPAKPFIKARGVDSVSSPVANVGLSNGAFLDAVVCEFGAMYSAVKPEVVGKAWLEIPEIEAGVQELKSEDWIYHQTPQFTFSLEAGSLASLSSKYGSQRTFEQLAGDFTARNGQIIKASAVFSGLVGRTLHKITDWTQELIPQSTLQPATVLDLGNLMNRLFGGDCRERDYRSACLNSNMMKAK